MSFIYAGLILGLVYRLFPIVAGQPYLSQFFMTEDGYLMLTVARNMAIGLGMSVSDGTIPTNGVQPLATFLFAVPYWLTGGDKVQSLVGIHLIAASAAVGGVFVVRALAARVLAPRDDDPVWPWLVALLWFVGPLLLDHTMNALETGIYTFVAVLALLKFAQVLEKGATVSMRDCLALGALSGITFLARNDGAFLVTAIFAVWALDSLFRQGIGIARTVGRLVPPGVLSLLIAAPWLINNKVNFGSIVPISGWSQAFGATFGQNLHLIPIKLFEHMFPMLPVPTSMENSPFVIWGCAAVVLGVMGWFLRAVWIKGGTIRLVVIAYVLHGIALSAYYGLNFGAPHFVSRYLSVLAPLLIIAALWCGMDLFRAVTGERWRTVLRLASVAAVVLSVALLGRPFLPGANGQGHFQVVDWIEANVPSDVWVGAVQTGTLGYWHDRTINLDGKVNPEALAALQTEGDILNYVSKSQIIYLADWHGIARWVEKNDFDQVFEVVTHQPEINLAVLKRRGAP
ncbi:hypothetical protein G5V65_15075 [Rhodobacter sp. HX-7-19]|uniref:Glycosyltransferase RgtA/B/C/D-like domain-containing protein n=2 Tax=Paragemmobacter kunshanensis TaxID=2583234 RepID=A0A6M1TV06_9RHOB|nr:hypothetical protein [Rhodobacter kunshanensis]